MDDATDKITELEAKIAFLEHLLDQLNDVVTKQQDQIDALGKDVVRLREELDSPADALPQHERPPHY